MSTESVPAKKTRARESPAPARPQGEPAGLRWLDALLLLAFLGLTFLLGVFPLKDTDFWWHLRTGDLIRATGQVPKIDSYLYGVQNRPWIDLHWVYQVAISWVYERGGVPALTLAKCAVTTLAVGLLVTARRLEWPLWAILTAWLPALVLLGGRMYVRPETLTLLYLSMFLAVLVRIERVPALALALPLVQVAWVNTQGLFILGPILFTAALIDAALRAGSFSSSRRTWWRTIGSAFVLTGLACLVNPYGIRGALYPLELARTMGNPVFSESIAELTPIMLFIKRDGLVSLPLRIHFLVMILGGLSFVLPIVWLVLTRWTDGGSAQQVSAAPERSNLPVKAERKKTRSPKPKKGTKCAVAVEPPWRLSVFRLLLFAAFSFLSLQATRNSHQFAAVVGAVTAWNFAEWVGAVRRRAAERKEDNDPAPGLPRGIVPRLVALSSILAVTFWIASGSYYAAAREGRTIGLGEEPLWYPHDAVKFAGKAGFPPRFLAFHVGHPSLYEYYFGPEKKVYADARLEVIGPEHYERYLELQRLLNTAAPGWSNALDAIGRPVVLVDLENSASSGGPLLTSPDWRCVYFDLVAAVFAHVTYGDVVLSNAVDFGARHFHPRPETEPTGVRALLAAAKGLRNLSIQTGRTAPEKGLPLVWLGRAYAHRAALAEPDRGDAWRLLGQFETLREPQPSQPVPRFRMAWNPVFDLASVRATYSFTRALEAAPDDFVSAMILDNLFQGRGMTEARIPLLQKLVSLTAINGLQRDQQAIAAAALPTAIAALGEAPPKTWDNLSQLNQAVNRMLADGRAGSAADYLEKAVPAPSRSWDEADRIATIKLHLGEPARARAVWQTAPAPPKAGLREARVAVTYLVEGKFEPARESYQAALAASPDLFEALYGLAVLELDAGRAPEALAAARKAVANAPDDVSRSAPQAIVSGVTPYATSPIATEK